MRTLIDRLASATSQRALSLHDALPISAASSVQPARRAVLVADGGVVGAIDGAALEPGRTPRVEGAAAGQRRRVRRLAVDRGEPRSEEHTSELQSRSELVCRLLLEKKKK